MKEIPLGNGLNAKVDDEDYEWLSQYGSFIMAGLIAERHRDFPNIEPTL